MRGCISKRKNGTYAYTIEMGKHPETGRRRQKMKSGFASRKEAEAALAQALAEVGRGSYITETKETVQDYFIKYLDLKRPQLRPGTVKTYKWLINYHIIPKLGQIPLAKLVPHHLVSMYEKLRIEAGLSPQSINHVHKVLHDGLATAVRHEVLTRNVAALVKPPKIPKTKTTVWTSEQLTQFLHYTEPYRYHMIILLAATCGLRRGEAIALRWEDVDLKARTLTVKQSYTRGEKGHIFQEPKTAAGIRTMAIPDVTMTALKKQKVMQAEDKLASGPKYNDHGLISQTKHGLPISPYYFEARWLDLLRRSGLPKIRFHDLRHTHASLLLKQNVHPKIVSERMGHSSVGITLDRYSHTYGVDYGAAERLDDLLAYEMKSL
ncbi:site-specific integrase [Paenibacillus polymyxa]|uniref:tyrosine-type recombinase/integrase n=1 Tax=Paenibacillus polymyxa TaxID=1406 RepID=UPI001BE94050|nr:tyrosine-type recombinase/integrase [Paenibacillus polymyxa]MBT2284259.1 site-specific integrase [Paenibacillus polymyxa]